MKDRTEFLKERINSLLEKLGRAKTDESFNLDDALKVIHTLEDELREEELINKVNKINSRERDRRGLIKGLLEFLPIDMDIFNNDMSIHKSKGKKYPELMGFIDKNNIRFSHKYGRLEASAYVNNRPQKFYLDGYQDGEVVPLSSIEEAYKLNNILPKDKTLKEVKKCIDKLKKIEAKFKEQLNTYETERKENDFYFLENEGIIGTSNSNLKTIYFK